MPFDESQYEESKLLELLAEDSEYAFQLIYDRHRKRIYSVALRYLKSPIHAQEVVQDVFLKLWFSRRKINASHGVEAWLYTVSKNNILNRLKRLANEWKAIRQLSREKNDSAPSPEDRMQDIHYSTILQDAVNRLPEQQQAVFRLARERGLTYSQIAEQLCISPLTVKTHMSRALESIRKELAEKGILLSVFLIQVI